MTFIQLMGWPVAACACSARDQEAMLAFCSIDGTVVLILDRILPQPQLHRSLYIFTSEIEY